MGKTAVFNQIVLYLETPNLDQNRPFGAKLNPSNKGAPGIAFVDAKLMTLATRPHRTNLHIAKKGTRLNSIINCLIFLFYVFFIVKSLLFSTFIFLIQ